MNPNLADAGKKTRFKPGKSGNPAGRPRRIPIIDILSIALELRLESRGLMRPALRAHFPEAKTEAHALAMFMIIKTANKGEIATFREIREMVEG
jgi:hypothetical protein